MKAIMILVAIAVFFQPIQVKAQRPATTAEMAEEVGLQEAEFIFFSSVVEAESNRSQEDNTGRIYIALTIWNRQRSELFQADTINEVLTAPGQFATVRDGHSVTDRTELSDQAVVEAYRMIQAGDAPNVLFFNCRGYNSLGEPYGDGPVGGNYFMTWEAEA